VPPTAPPDGIDVSSPNIYGSDFRTMARGLTWHHGAAYVTVNPTRHGGREINFVEIQLTTFRNLDIYECCTFFWGVLFGAFIHCVLALMLVVVAMCQPQTTEATSPLTVSHRTSGVWLSGCLVCLFVWLCPFANVKTTGWWTRFGTRRGGGSTSACSRCAGAGSRCWIQWLCTAVAAPSSAVCTQTFTCPPSPPSPLFDLEFLLSTQLKARLQ